MPTIHQLYRKQVIDTDLNTAWDFISSPKNLDTITPDDMSFEIITDLPATMYDGLLIEYRVGIPIIGRQTWLTEIKHIRERHSFVDEQRIGPYKLWLHYHEITEHPEGVQFIDCVNYVVPFGPCGQLAHAIYVKKQLKYVFDYRAVAMRANLSKSEDSAGEDETT
jgi:ligand-binding SRPBCC domain-containing protein